MGTYRTLLEEYTGQLMLRDALLLFVHIVLIVTLASLLVGELAIFRQTLPGDLVRRLQVLDRAYGVVAGLVVLSGLSLLFYSSFGPLYFVRNPVFWIKMALFLAVALISIAPTLAFIRWERHKAADGSIALEFGEYRRLRTLLWLQIGIFIFIPLCATLMVAGI